VCARSIGGFPALMLSGVQVDDYSQAPLAILIAAERDASRILGEVGLRAVRLKSGGDVHWKLRPVGPAEKGENKGQTAPGRTADSA
jgi:hypothetical protein